MWRLAPTEQKKCNEINDLIEKSIGRSGNPIEWERDASYQVCSFLSA
jgi:hypothetical protein